MGDPLRSELSKEWTLYAILGLLVVALWLPRLQGPIDFRWDGGVYYVLGTSLAEGKGYRLLNEPGEIQANQYPPLLPLIIAAHQLVLGTSDPIIVGRALRLSAFLGFALYAGGIWMLLRGYLTARMALFGTVVCLLSVHTFFLSDLCFPDILFGLLVTAFLLSATGRIQSLPSRWAGLFAVLAFAARTAGIAILAAWVCEALVKRQWKAVAARAALAAVPIAIWFSYVHFVEHTREYQEPAYAYQRADYQFYNVSYARNVALNDPFDPSLGYATVADRVSRTVANIPVLIRVLGESVSASRRVWEVERDAVRAALGVEVGPDWLIDVPLYLLGASALAGTILLVYQGGLLVALCAWALIALVSLTPWPAQFNRYLMPVLPVVSLSLCVALTWLLARAQAMVRVQGRAILLATVCAVVGGILVQQLATVGAIYAKRFLPVQYLDRHSGRVSQHLFFYMDSYRALDAGADWLLAHAGPSDVIAVSMPHWVHLRTGNKVVMPPFESDPLKAQQLLESVPVTYLVLDEGLAIDSQRFTKGVVERFPERWKRVYGDNVTTETGDRHEQAFAIYERLHPGAATGQAEQDPVTPTAFQPAFTGAEHHETR
ncbi:MAG: hypothetical protein IT389_02965 [Nitrospira sp.]|nr:hypothetical protein [Nitrospira sp.]